MLVDKFIHSLKLSKSGEVERNITFINFKVMI